MSRPSFARALVRLRRLARRCTVAAVSVCASVWSLGLFVLYTPVAWLVAGVMMLVTALVALVCLALGHRRPRPKVSAEEQVN